MRDRGGELRKIAVARRGERSSAVQGGDGQLPGSQGREAQPYGGLRHQLGEQKEVGRTAA